MPELNSNEYYRGRERHERALAAACIDPAIAAIHSEMADHYRDLSEAGGRPPAAIQAGRTDATADRYGWAAASPPDLHQR